MQSLLRMLIRYSIYLLACEVRFRCATQPEMLRRIKTEYGSPSLTYRRGRDSSGLRKACCRKPPPKGSVLPTNQRGRSPPGSLPTESGIDAAQKSGSMSSGTQGLDVWALWTRQTPMPKAGLNPNTTPWVAETSGGSQVTLVRGFGLG